MIISNLLIGTWIGTVLTKIEFMGAVIMFVLVLSLGLIGLLFSFFMISDRETSRTLNNQEDEKKKEYTSGLINGK